MKGVTALAEGGGLGQRRRSVVAPGWELLLVALLGMTLLLYFTRSGVAIRGDSVRYVMTAENLVAGRGYSRTSGGGELYPETGFAPFLSVVLAGMRILGVDLFAGARILNVVLFGLNILLVGAMVRRFTRSRFAGVLAGLLLLSAPSILESHGWLMSEPLFVFLMLLSLICLLQFLDSGHIGLLILGGILAGAASVTRYVGLGLAPAGGVAILGLARGNRRARLAQSIAFAGLAVAPLLVWMVRNQAAGDSGLANRELIFHMIRPDLVRFYLFEAATWALPKPIVVARWIRAGVALALVGLAPALYFRHVWREARAGVNPAAGTFANLPWVCLLNIGSYLVVLVLNSMFFDAGTTEAAATRYLVPFFTLLLIVEVALYAWSVHRANRRSLGRVLGIGLGILLLGLYAWQSIALAQASTLPLGFTGIRQRWSQAASELIRLAGDGPIISNNPEMVYYLIDRPAYFMPILYDPYRQQERPDFEAQLELATERMKDGSVLVIFGEPKPWEQVALEQLPIAMIVAYEDVIIYRYSAGEESNGGGRAVRSPRVSGAKEVPHAVWSWIGELGPRCRA